MYVSANQTIVCILVVIRAWEMCTDSNRRTMACLHDVHCMIEINFGKFE